MRFVREDNDVGPISKHLRRLKLVDQSKDISMIPAQELTQMRAAHRVALVTFGFGYGSDSLERLRDLLVEFDTIGNDDERPVARSLAEDFLREEDHREALAATLSLPKYAAAAMTKLAGL